MLWKLDFLWLVMAFGTVSGVSYMMCLMMESSVGREGFGPFLNAAIITAGFFGTILGVNYRGIAFANLQEALIYGLAGAFALLLAMFVLRALLARIRA